MIKFNLFIVLSFIALPLFSQDLGVLFTLNGVEVNRLFEFGESVPPNKLVGYNTLKSYRNGMVLKNSGDTLKGDFKVSGKDVLKMIRGEKDTANIDLKKIQYFKTGTDSFLVVSDTIFIDKLKKKERNGKSLLLHIYETDRYDAFLIPIYGKSDIVFYDKITGQWINTYSMLSEAFQRETVSLFSHIPWVQKNKETFKSGDALKLLKVSNFYSAFLNKERIFFDAEYKEIKDLTDKTYSALVTKSESSIWEISVFNKADIMTLRGTFSSIFPFEKHGEMRKYYSNGQLKEIGNYKNGKPIGEFKRYQRDGSRLYDFKYTDNHGKRKYLRTYVGDSLTLNGGNNKVVYYYSDEVNSRKVKHVIESGRLRQVNYFSKDLTDNVHLLPEHEARFEFRQMINYPEEAIQEELSGRVVAKVLLNNKGRVEKVSIVYSSGEVFEGPVKYFLSKKENYKSKPALFNKKPVHTEFALVFKFDFQRNINSSFKSGWIYHDPFFMNQFMRPLQPVNIVVPSLPRF